MGSVSADEHKFHPCHQLFLAKKSPRKIDIPPRMLLSRLEANFDSSRSGSSVETLLRKFLPYNNPHDDDDDDYDPYSAEHFRMYEFKIRKCTRSRSHDWTDCPFVHPGEKARRRDPRRYHYSGTVCPDFRRAGCPRGDNCEFAHGVFECWLHPARYRTEACKDGKNCKRKICFFAHTSKQLRILSSEEDYTINSPISKYGKHCCGHCHCVTASPTSTLLGMSDYLSPPISPVKSRVQMGGFSPVSRFSDRQVELNHEVLRYEEALTELIESMRVDEYSSTHGGGRNRKLSWVDVSNFDIGDEQQQFVMSPMGPSHSGSGQFVTRKQTSSLGFKDEKGGGAPDLGWVNDLLT